MSSVFRISLAYMICAFALTVFLSPDLLETLVLVTATATQCARLIASGMAWLLLLIPFAVICIGPRTFWARIGDISLMIAASIFLQTGYFLAKSAIPRLVPFFADPYLAQFDLALFFGHDAWQVTHALVSDNVIWLFPILYMPVWSVIALGFPTMLAATDPDGTRATRYAWLFFLTWVIVGNLLAKAGSSVGPVYFDRLLGSDRFAELKVALEQSGFAGGSLAQLQDRLWAASNDPSVPISFVSAFPSVHVGIATVAALYLKERAPRLAPVGTAYLVMISIIAVYSGYHYAIDVIAAWGVVVLMSAALRRWIPATGEDAVFPEVAAPGYRPSA